MVQTLEGHSGRHGAVANDGDDVVVLAAQIARRGHARGRRDRRAGVPRPEEIVRALVPVGEPREALVLADGVHLPAPARDHLVDVHLMAYVPEHAVPGRIELAVKRERQLDDAEIRGEVSPTADALDSRDELFANLLGQLLELFRGKQAQIIGGVDVVK